MIREITQQLLDWKNRRNRKPLIMMGARQVGKTYTINEFAKHYFKNLVEINFERDIEYKSIFKKNNIKDIINELTILKNTEISPGSSIIFLDEIQACPEAIVVLRYFYEQYPNLHVIAAGSLLDHTLNEMNLSMPVGRIEFLYMYPLSFKEFLFALSHDKLIEYVNEYSFKNQYNEAIHEKLSQLLRLYFFIGGMPEAVKVYLDHSNLKNVERVHQSIITTLQYDFGKYGTKKQQEHLLEVFRYSALNAGEKVKYAKINREVRSSNLKQAFKRLEMSRITHLVKHTGSDSIPITKYIKEEIFKPLFFDIGLTNYLSGIKLIDPDKLLTINEGAMAEQFIGQELIANIDPDFDAKLYYWVREEKNTNAEIDYIYQYQNEIYPIEVKAGKSGSLKSLHVYLAEKKLSKGIRFNMNIPSIGNFESTITVGQKQITVNYQLISLPLYMAFTLKNILSNI